MDFGGTPNFLAYLVFFGWIPLSLVVFATTKPLKAAWIVYLGGILLIPERIDFDLPLLPPIAKSEIAALAALLGLVWRNRKRLRGKLPRSIRFLLLVIAVGAAITAQTNPDPQIFGPLVLPGHEATEIFGLPARDMLMIGLPFLLGFVMAKSEEDLKMLFSAFVIGALIHIPLILFEVRFSPQLHLILYGYHQHAFNQTVRFGGYRPMVFLQHGLALAMYMLVSVIAAFTALKAKVRLVRLKPLWLAWMLWLALVVVKSVGAIVMSLVMIPAILVIRPRRQMLIVMLLSLVVLIYPILKITDTFPDQKLVEISDELINAERAQSLEFRFENDIMLVERAETRKWFGWGSYGRARVFDKDGYDISVTDGYWIIVYGNKGMVGLFSSFLVLLVPLNEARRRLKKIADPRLKIMVGGLTLMLLVSTFDLLPNGLYNSLPYFLAGALMGACQFATKPQPAQDYSDPRSQIG